jgi:hypothetical protein
VTDFRDLGVMLGRGLKREPVAVKPDTIIVPAPLVSPSNTDVAVNFDVDRLGEVIASCLTFPESKPVDVIGAAEVLADAINGLGDVDLTSVTAALTGLVDAVKATDSIDVASIVSAFDRNTKAIEAQTQAIAEQTAVLAKSKTIEYDNQGRVVRVKVG